MRLCFPVGLKRPVGDQQGASAPPAGLPIQRPHSSLPVMYLCLLWVASVQPI